jgi:hypothetical protein
MVKNLNSEHKDFYEDVAAIVTAMTNDEKPFLYETFVAVLKDPDIGQIILCIEENNDWLDGVLGSLVHDARLKVVRMPIMHIGAIRNKALQYVEKPWIAYCDGDDVWCKGKIRAQRILADKTNADLVGTGHYLTDEAGNIRAYGLSIFIPMPSSWLVRTDVMKKYPFNEAFFLSSEDGKWWIKTTKYVQKVKCPKILLRYRVRYNSISSLTESKKRKLKLIILGGIPIFGKIIYIATYIIWIFTKNQPYRWKPIWTEWLKEYDNNNN